MAQCGCGPVNPFAQPPGMRKEDRWGSRDILVEALACTGSCSPP